jgi:hypothetical protein
MHDILLATNRGRQAHQHHSSFCTSQQEKKHRIITRQIKITRLDSKKTTPINELNTRQNANLIRHFQINQFSYLEIRTARQFQETLQRQRLHGDQLPGGRVRLGGDERREHPPRRVPTEPHRREGVGPAASHRGSRARRRRRQRGLHPREPHVRRPAAIIAVDESRGGGRGGDASVPGARQQRRGREQGAEDVAGLEPCKGESI